ncbi:rhodanese-like domain-containing protein [Paucilactobacillus sp. N302-9]
MVIAVSSGFLIFDIIVILIFVGWLIMRLYQTITRKRYAKVIEQEQFEQGMHKAQVIDLREKNDFDKGHILGARSVPYSMMSQRYAEIRKDLPVYLYDQGMVLSTRCAATLGKKGYQDLSILKGGYAQWQGKTKSKKY